MASAASALSDAGSKNQPEEYYWLWVLCLLGLDYFSTLAYQPSITFHEVGRLGPLATAVVVIVTLFGALPVYCYLAGRSPGGQGSLGILASLIRGWRGKTLVLILLGFAATDFTMLKSLSLADASVHVLSQQDTSRAGSIRDLASLAKEHAAEWCDERVISYCNEQLLVTVFLGIVGFFCWFVLRKGFNRNVLILSVPLIGLYLLMNAILIGGGLWHLSQEPNIVTDWLAEVQEGKLLASASTHQHGEGWGWIALACLLALPNLALGLSGFELSMILMPQVEGKPGEHPPQTRIHNTRKVLILAAVTMSVYLLGGVFVTTLLIPPTEFARQGDPLLPADAIPRKGYANDRALAYLAHGGPVASGHDAPLLPICGREFGMAYDAVTVLILCLAGTSVMTALSVLLPQFLLRFGMEFRWSQRWGVLLLFFAVINTVVTLWFRANVEDQRGAYATGVLVLIAGASVVTVFDKRREHDRHPSEQGGIRFFLGQVFYSLVALVFVATMLAVATRSTSGLGISFCFIAATLAMSIVSRAFRADERRTIGFEFKDDQSRFLWESLRLADFPVLIPIRPGRISHEEKERQIRGEHQLTPEAEIVFLEIVVDDPSDFFQTLLIEVVREGNRFVIRVTNGVSTPHAIAAIALEMSRYSKPPGLHFGWTEMDLLSASWSYLAFGEGNIPWKVRELIHRMEPDPAKRPRVVVG